MNKIALITEDNLIGSIASAILKLKTLNLKNENATELKVFIDLIKFVGEADKADYMELLYDKNFFVSESVLSNIHNELKTSEISKKIDFSELISMLSKNVKEYVPLEIEETMSKLKEIMVVLLNSKSRNQVYL